MAQPVHIALQQVTIPGWLDEDGQPVTSAIVEQSDAPAAAKKPTKIDAHRKTWENAWWASGAEERAGSPYLSREALKDKLAQDGNAERTIRNMINPSYSDKLIGALLLSGLIEASDGGWIMVNETHSTALILRKSAG